MPYDVKKQSGEAAGAAFGGALAKSKPAKDGSKDALRERLRTMNYEEQKEALRPPADDAGSSRSGGGMPETPNFHNDAHGSDRYRDFNPLHDPNLVGGGGKETDATGNSRSRGQGGYTLTSAHTSNSANNSGIDGSPTRNLNIDDILAAFGAMGRQDIANFIKSASGKPKEELLRELAWWCFSNSQDPEAIRDGLMEAGEFLAYLDFDTFYSEFEATGVNDLKDKEMSSNKTGLSSNAENGVVGGGDDADKDARSEWTSFVFDGKGGGVEIKSGLVAAYYEEVDQVLDDDSLVRWERVRTGNGDVYFARAGKPVTAKSEIPDQIWYSAAGDLGKGEENLVQVRNDAREHRWQTLSNGTRKYGYAPMSAAWNIKWRAFQ